MQAAADWLVIVVQMPLEDPAARTAFFDALRTVSSGSDYRRVMERVAR